MARIIIEILDDKKDGKDIVKVAALPSYEDMANMVNSGHKATSAHGYAMAALRHVSELSKKTGGLDILIPRIGL